MLTERILQEIRCNPFYQNVSNDTLSDFLKRMNGIDWTTIIKAIPDAFLSTGEKESLAFEIEKRSAIDWKLAEILEKLSTIKPVSEQERKMSIAKNRERFKSHLTKER
jgi:hypothetical protein